MVRMYQGRGLVIEDWGLGRTELKLRPYANQSARVDNAVWHALKQGCHTGRPYVGVGV